MLTLHSPLEPATGCARPGLVRSPVTPDLGGIDADQAYPLAAAEPHSVSVVDLRHFGVKAARQQRALRPNRRRRQQPEQAYKKGTRMECLF